MSLFPPFQSQNISLRIIASSIVCGLVLLALSSCGGGGVSTASLPGTGGTGIRPITAMGPVTGFGSVIVNGIRFDDTAAQVRLDDALVSGGTVRLGMTAKVMGTESTTPSVTATSSTQGAANSIEIWSAAQGVVRSVNLPSTVTVAGMNLIVDAGTVYVGVTSLAAVKPNAVIKVWGLPSSVDFTQWTITRIEVLKAPQQTVSTGKVVMSGGKLTLNGMKLINTPAGLAEGQLIRVMGTVSGTANDVLTAIETTVLAEAGSTTPSAGYAQVQGVVSGILNRQPGLPGLVTRLSLGASVVDISSATVLPAGTIITQGMRLQVQGEWTAGELVASQVKAISQQDLRAVDVEGVIESLTGVSNIVVLGQRFDATSLGPAFETLLNSLRVGLKVRMVGMKKDDFVVISSIEIK